jgi:undecaprenyl-diphosphatase
MIDPSTDRRLRQGGRQPLFWLMAAAVLLGLVFMADRPLSAAAQSLPPPVVACFARLTRWGQADWMLVPSLALLLLSLLSVWLARERALKLAALEQAGIFGYIFASVALSGLVANLLKQLIGRARPTLFDQFGDFAFSFNSRLYDQQGFPSGHSTNAFAFAVALTLLWPGLRWPALAYAIGIAASRVVLGQHYPTDVVAGALLGSLGAFTVRGLFAARGWAFRRTAAGIVPRTTALRRLPRHYRK